MHHRPVRSQYEDFMRHVNTQGVLKSDRTGTGTRSVFGHQMRFDLNEGFHDQKSSLALYHSRAAVVPDWIIQQQLVA